MASYLTETIKDLTKDDKGNIIDAAEHKKCRKIEKSDEPDYIKLYTKMWCEFNQIPERYRQLFLSLVCRMTYANTDNTEEEGGQIVYTIGPSKTAIMAECGWKDDQTYYRGLKALCEYNAMRKIGRGVYQINPHYAGRGGWKYNTKLAQGGVQDIIARFEIATGKVETKFVWHKDDKDCPF